MRKENRDSGLSFKEIALLYGTLAGAIVLVMTDGAPIKAVVNPRKIEPTPTPILTPTPEATKVSFMANGRSGVLVDSIGTSFNPANGSLKHRVIICSLEENRNIAPCPTPEIPSN